MDKKVRAIGVVVFFVSTFLINYILSKLQISNSLNFYQNMLISVIISGIVGFIYYSLVKYYY